MADLLSKLRMLDAAPRRPAPAARGAQEGCYRSQATFPLPIFTDLRHLTPAVMESAFGFAFPSDLRPEDILFLDTETTGLAGGAGTVAFLVGMGYFTGRRASFCARSRQWRGAFPCCVRSMGAPLTRRCSPRAL